MSDGLATLVRFVDALAAEGIRPGPARSLSFCEAASLVPAEDLYLAGANTLISGPDQRQGYDRVFREFFGSAPAAAAAPEDVEPFGPEATFPASGSGARETEQAVAVGGEQASTIDLVRGKSFAECSDEEILALSELWRRLPLRLPQRVTRRYRRSRSGPTDVRRLVRHAGRSWGEPILIPRRQRISEPRPLVILVDISGSMRGYARGMLLFAHAVLRVSPGSEAYAFGTSLTPLTVELRSRSADAALALAAARARDWEGGTRIGASLHTFLEESGWRAQWRQGIAVVCSDGFETGDPELLGETTARLARRFHRLVWLNPLAADPRYEPLAQGMGAALPHIDVFDSGHSLQSLLELRWEG